MLTVSMLFLSSVSTSTESGWKAQYERTRDHCIHGLGCKSGRSCKSKPCLVLTLSLSRYARQTCVTEKRGSELDQSKADCVNFVSRFSPWKLGLAKFLFYSGFHLSVEKYLALYFYVTTRPHTFSRASSTLRVFTSSSEWFTGFSVSFVIG